MAKGISLSVNTIVFIVLVIIVLVSLLWFFTGQSSSAITSAENQRLLAEGCLKLRSDYSCDVTKLSSVSAGPKNLLEICRLNGYSNADVCAKYCGCAQQGGTQQGGQQIAENQKELIVDEIEVT